MKNHISNGRESRFDVISSINEEEVPQDLNKEIQDDKIFYREE